MTSNDSPEQPAGRPADKSGVSRRRFLISVGAAAVAEQLLLRPGLAQETPAAVAKDNGPGVSDPSSVMAGETSVTLTINGKARQVSVEPRTTLLSALRDRLDPALTGPKLVCDAGTCGACTVLVDGRTAYGCSLLAIDMVGRKIETVEGFGTPGHLSPVQAAFCEKDAMMCGFCTSGFVTAATGLLRKNPSPSNEEIREGCKGNFCRCGTFPHVFEAVAAASQTIQRDGTKV